MTLACLAIMQDEAAYVERWAQGLRRLPGMFDEVLVVDGGSTDDTPDRLHALGICIARRPFLGNFADQRNHGLDLLHAEWVFELDADEVPSVPLLGGLRAICQDADRAQMDVVGIPRLNFLDGRLVQSPGARGLDYQYRLHRRACRWRGAVHEEVVGYRARYELELSEGHYLLHDKSSERHAARNAYYGTLTP